MQQSLDAGQTVKFTASVSNDSTSRGVSWSLSGSSCSGNACGTLTNATKTGATYNAPSTVTSVLTVTVKATSVAKSSVSASSTATVNPSPSVTTVSLPGGVVGTYYSASLKASGGTGSYSWSITAGSLPAGFSLDASTGVISGTPTTSGTTSFTVQVTDSAPTPLSATQSLSITIADRLIITNSLLPNGSVNVAYSATLQASGGTKPYSWSVTSGSLPVGLTLDASTGLISGTPTTSQNYSFTLQVTDASTQTATQQLSITIEPALVITTASLADGTVNVAYSATLEATYATLPVTWSISSGALPTGLTLDANTGVISGTPTTAETSNFTVMVTDSTAPAPQTAIQSLSLAINSAGPNNTGLSGRYAFLLSGYDTHGNRVAVAGSLVADGAGNITGGVEDLNDTGVAPQTSLTIQSGAYSIGADNRGTITFTNSSGSTYTMAVAMGNLVGGTAEAGSAVEFDSSGYLMSGVIDWQNSASFLKQDINGSYAFGLTGSDMAGSRLSVAGQFAADGSGGITGGVFDADDDGTPTAAGTIAATSTYNVDTTTGRCTATLNGISPAPADYVFYIVSGSRLLALSIDAASAEGLVTGNIDAQTGGPYSNSSLNGTVVMGVGSASAGGSQVRLGVVTLDGSGNAAFSVDENSAGTLTTVTGNGTYTAPDASTGRFTLAPPPGIPSLAGYLVSANKAFVVGADNGVTAGTFQAQSAGPFSNSSLNFTAFFGDQEFATAPVPPSYGVLPATLSAGVFTFDSAGNVSTVTDENVQGTLLSDQSSSTSYSVASNGRVTLGSSSSILYLISPSEFASMSATAGDPNPKLGFGWQ